MQPNPLRVNSISLSDVEKLLARFGLSINVIEPERAIPGSFWGDEEAGLIQNTLHIRPDTPIHSIFHESCHYICMTPQRRSTLHTNAGGTQDEENAVCYLQILLSDEVSFINRNRMMQDMDDWGYSFRLGSARNWFDRDAEDAREWLLQHQLIDQNNNVSFKLRA